MIGLFRKYKINILYMELLIILILSGVIIFSIPILTLIIDNWLGNYWIGENRVVFKLYLYMLLYNNNN